jgi:glutaminyl-tRNA synthetase
VTRFPPEPNGFLHIGHAKAICLNFGLADSYAGQCHLRFDDTNPTTEDQRFVESIQNDVRWLGFDWGDNLYYSSDYYARLYDYAVTLIRKGKAYVCSLSEEQLRSYRGSITEPGKNSPFRDRSVEENLDLFARMRGGEFAEAEHVLRAKIDMTAANMKLRDPPIYRIKHATHYRSGDTWCIYPLYDFAHALSDAIEGITHSICTLEFENNRDIYDWVLQHAEPDCRPQQIEFARLNLNYTMMSKRKLAELVTEGHVSGWDDPRMPTIAGLRRRGVTPAAIRAFCEMIGVAKNNSVVDIGKLEYCIREDLNQTSPRAMCVLDPLAIEISNYPETQRETFDAPCFPKDVRDASDTRSLPFSRQLYIERADFMREPPAGFFRLRPGGEVRLRYAYVIRCDEVIEDPKSGRVLRLRCSYDPDTRGAAAPIGRKVKGTIHWLSVAEATPCTVREYDRLFCSENPSSSEELNPNSLQEFAGAFVEPGLAQASPGSRYQFERHGYYCRESCDEGALVFNRTVGLRDSWAKVSEPAARVARKPQPPVATQKQVEIEVSEAMKPLIDLGISRGTAAQLTRDARLLDMWTQARAHHDAPQSLANWLVAALAPQLDDASGLPQPAAFAELVALVDGGSVSATAGKRVLSEMLRSRDPPQVVVERLGASQISDENALAPTIEEVLAAHPDEVARYRAGKTALMGFFVGHVMKATRGSANPKLVSSLLRDKLA